MKILKIFSLIFIVFTIKVYSQTVYTTPSGTKYHLANCRMVKNISAASSIEKAASNGFYPCKICKPPFKTSSTKPRSKKKENGTNGLSRCKGKTKKGKRCKRKTRIGNDYCFQHIP